MAELPKPIVVPDLASVARRSIPNVVIGKVVPVVLFIGLLEIGNATWALLAALAWSGGAVGCQIIRGKRVPGLVLLSALMLAAKTIAAIASGSLFVYFIPPTITTALVGVAFFVSVRFGSPLAGRLAEDFCPFDDETRSHPVLYDFFIRLSLVWAATSLINAAITLWVLLTQSTTTFVVVKSLLGPTTTIITLAIGAVWFKILLAQSGTSLQFSPEQAASLR